MKKKQLYKLLKERMIAVSSVSPQELGSLTYYWKFLAHFLKTNTLQTFFFIGFLTSFLLWFLTGDFFVKLASLLQYGF